MSTSTSVHSNAFNFSSYIQSGVDPRTGQYTLSIRLPELQGNDLQGPGFELALFYSPLNVEDSGFGKGWNLQLTQVRTNLSGSDMVTLSSGETYQITGESSATGRLEMSEQKLRQFDLYEEPGGYRVEHRSGLVEVLRVMGSGEGEVALPVEMHSPLGHVLYLDYAPFGNGHMRLSELSDPRDVLLTLERIGNSRVEIRCHPTSGDDGGPLARYVMTLGNSDNRVTRISLPTTNDAGWRFDYRDVRGYLCLTECKTPYGGLEYLFYEDGGHEFPLSAGHDNLPRVTRHETDGRFQAKKVVHYEYPGSSNFLGGGSSIPWSDDGRDNLYGMQGDYSYQSVEIHEQRGQRVRKVTRTFNRFHLLTEHATEQGDNRLQAFIRYADKLGDFKSQPPYFQLPHEETQRWSLISDGSRRREEKQLTTYDTQGNVLTRRLPNGVEEVNVWYSAEEEGNVGGFVRNLKTRTVIPANASQGAAPTLIQEFGYRVLAPLGSYLEQEWRLLECETLSEAASPPGTFLEKISKLYHEESAERFSYGRVMQQTVSYPGFEEEPPFDTVTHYAYTLAEDVRALETEEKLVGFDGESKTITLQHSLETGEPLLNRDDNDVEIRYEYDALRRVTREIVAPGKAFEAERTYKYFLCAYDHEQAEQRVTDVKQVETRTLFDGLHRPIFEEREDRDSATYAGASRPIYRALYDELDQLVEETEIDWLGDRLLELTRHIRYDDWGQQYAVLNPDGTTDVEAIDQVASQEGPVHRSWREVQQSRVSGITETSHNLFEKPTRIERFALDGTTPVSLQVNGYDGLGRLSREARGSGAAQRVDEYRYDAFDRLREHRLADGTNRVYRTYAGHSRNDLPVSIKVGNTEQAAKLLGLQTFDGLERRTRATTGGRCQKFEYDPGERQPHWVEAPDKTRIEYRYQPALGEEPVMRVLAGKTAHYDYDPKNARLTHCDEPGDDENSSYGVDRRYFLSNGEVKSESRTVGGEPTPFDMTYDYSYRSRLRAYVDVLGQTQLYDFDRFGRLEKTTLYAPGPKRSGYRLRRLQARQQLLLESSFEYDDQGRMASFTTADASTGQTLATLLEYDEFDREVLRTFDFGDTLQTLRQEYDEFDCLKSRTLKERPKGSDESEARELRAETYQYDRRGRLSVYDCTGPQAPVDPSGRVIEKQVFGFDGLDNIVVVSTKSPGEAPQLTLYKFDYEDPAQLSHIVLPDKQVIQLDYDANGNLTRDEQGRQLTYDGLNRLLEVVTADGTSCRYDYDPENILSGTTAV
ncbi:MAG: RHS repeat domain-containing protein [Pseudomonas sp.]